MTKKRSTFYSTIILFVLLTLSILKPEFATSADPIINEYDLTAQSWSFIELTNLTENQLLDFEWLSELTVQSSQVTFEQFTTMQGLGLTERSEYFETLNYIEGKYDSGRTTTSSDGKIWFIFFNQQTETSKVTVSVEYRNGFYEPWKIGLVTTVIAVVVLSIALYIAIRLRKKMLEEQLAEERAKRSPAQKYMEL